MCDFNRIFLIGNLDSILFRNRINIITKNCKSIDFKIINTSRRKVKFVIKYFFDVFIVVVSCLFLKKSKIVYHGAYNSILWILVLFNKNIISILQGSELEKDYTMIRSFLINLILKKSKLIICRNEKQVSFIKNIIDVRFTKFKIINWGLDKKLFSLKKSKPNNSIHIISPRATQSEYNIDLIFEAIKKLKKDNFNIKFTYIKFNANIEVNNKHIIDNFIISPSQDELWHQIVNNDICISIPSYDGFSNIVVESLALGTHVICSDLDAYKEFKNKKYLIDFIKLCENKDKTVNVLYKNLVNLIKNINNVRSNSKMKRNYIKGKFSQLKNFEYLVEEIEK